MPVSPDFVMKVLGNFIGSSAPQINPAAIDPTTKQVIIDPNTGQPKFPIYKDVGFGTRMFHDDVYKQVKAANQAPFTSQYSGLNAGNAQLAEGANRFRPAANAAGINPNQFASEHFAGGTGAINNDIYNLGLRSAGTLPQQGKIAGQTGLETAMAGQRDLPHLLEAERYRALTNEANSGFNWNALPTRQAIDTNQLQTGLVQSQGALNRVGTTEETLDEESINHLLASGLTRDQIALANSRVKGDLSREEREQAILNTAQLGRASETNVGTALAQGREELLPQALRLQGLHAGEEVYQALHPPTAASPFNLNPTTHLPERNPAFVPMMNMMGAKMDMSGGANPGFQKIGDTIYDVRGVQGAQTNGTPAAVKPNNVRPLGTDMSGLDFTPVGGNPRAHMGMHQTGGNIDAQVLNAIKKIPGGLRALLNSFAPAKSEEAIQQGY